MPREVDWSHWAQHSPSPVGRWVARRLVEMNSHIAMLPLANAVGVSDTSLRNIIITGRMTPSRQMIQRISKFIGDEEGGFRAAGYTVRYKAKEAEIAAAEASAPYSELEDFARRGGLDELDVQRLQDFFSLLQSQAKYL